MRMLTFANRTFKEIIRDPLTVAFGLGFPLVVLLLLTAIQANVPVALFELDKLTPGICVFGLSFVSLFSAMLISKDRETSLQRRLLTTPLTAADFLLGYSLPMLPISVLQSVICYVAALILGLKPTVGILWALLFLLPAALLYIAIGLLCGSLLTDKQVGGICGALLTNLTAWLSGVWFDVSLMGKVFKKIADALPFIHAVELERAALAGDISAAVHELPIVLGYAVILSAVGIAVFTKKMKEN
ncbi:MAG: ABC transporter permease [Oscillospiraceae bacterium]|nr:ABC transporter permease [Oscillospiraceae bacterium]